MRCALFCRYKNHVTRLVRPDGGFTLPELLVALTIGLVLIAAIYGTYNFQNRVSLEQDREMEAGQNARNGMDILSRDLRMLGTGVPSGVDKITVATNLSLTFLFNMDNITAQLTSQAASGTATLTVDSSSNFKAGQTVYISDGTNYESKVLAANPPSATSITLPSNLANSYPAGSTVNVVHTMKYAYDGSPKELQRNLDSGGDQALASNIDFVSFKYYDSSGNQLGAATPYTGVTLSAANRSLVKKINVQLVSKTSKEEALASNTVTYEDGTTQTDGYKRVWLQSDIVLRNMP